MALWIIKESFRELFKKFKYYVIPCIFSFSVDIINYCFAHFIPFSGFFIYFFLFLIELPIFIIFYEKSLLSCFRDQRTTILLSAIIYSCFFVLIDHILGAPKTNAGILLYKNGVVFFEFFFLLFAIELVKNNVNPPQAILNIIKICSKNTLKKLWLLIKLFLIEEFIYLSFCVLCFLALLASPAPEISQMLQSNAYFVFMIPAHLFIYPYLSIRACFYYDIISLN